MKIIVCGGRYYRDSLTFCEALNKLKDLQLIIHGDASGADTMANHYALARGIAQVKCPANWSQYGHAAGPIRNKSMLIDHKPDLVVAFPGGRGTANMINLAKRAGVPVWEPVDK